jgi:N-methylhydantoinase A
MLMSDFKHDFVRAYKATIEGADLGLVAGLLAEMEAQGRATLKRERVEPGRIEARNALDLRYVGQWHELTLPVGALDVAQIASAFHAQHDLLFGYSSPEMPVEILACRVTTVGRAPKLAQLALPETRGGPDEARVGERPVWSPSQRRLVESPVYDGHVLGPGVTLVGPAIVELANTTIVVLDGFDLLLDRFGSFILQAGERGRERAAAFAAGGSVAP